MSPKDYYSTLQISRSASPDEVSAAYRKLARQYHPDVNQAADAERLFKEIGEAYGVLKDPEKRALYDRYGASWESGAQGPVDPSQGFDETFGASGFAANVGNLEDLGSMFEQFFGHTGGEGREAHWRGPTRGRDVESVLRLSVEQAYRGGQHQIELPQLASGGRTKVLKVKVPAGVQPGQRIRLAGQGGVVTPGAQAGDLFLRVQIDDSERFRLDGGDLVAPLALKPWQAALGATVNFDTLDANLRLKVPAGTSSGRRIRLRGRGYPDGAGGRGDLYAEASIVIPAQLSSEQREVYERLAQLDEASENASRASSAA